MVIWGAVVRCGRIVPIPEPDHGLFHGAVALDLVVRARGCRLLPPPESPLGLGSFSGNAVSRHLERQGLWSQPVMVLTVTRQT